MIPLLLFGVALVVRAIVGLAFSDPAYPDSFYYANLARQLADGNGFQIDYVWNFVDVGGRLPADPTLPIPSNAHWMPLAALIQVPFIWLLGPTSLAASLPFWLVGAAAASLTWAIGRDAGLGPTATIAAGLLAAVPGGVTPFLSQPDNFGLFMTLGGLALWLAARGAAGDRRSFVLGGLVVGLATLARNDGVLLGIPFVLVAAVDLRRPRPGGKIGMLGALGCLALFALVMGPWVLRQLEVFGTISPSAASGRILWITEYRELYSISSETTLNSFLSQGLGPLLESRIGGFVAAVSIFALWPLMAVLAPFAIVGAWSRSRDPAFTPFYVYAAMLFLASGLLFAVHVPYGTFIHSAVALLPHSFLLVAVGIRVVVTWVARRRTHWNAEQAVAVFTAGAVAIALLGATVRTVVILDEWQRDREIHRLVGEALAAEPMTDRLMSPDAGAYRYVTGRGGIVTPDDPLPVIEEALRAYDIRWLVLERNHLVAALVPVLVGDIRPAWLSRPILTVTAVTLPDEPRGGTEIPPADGRAAGAPAAALYAVCLAPTDTRCQP